MAERDAAMDDYGRIYGGCLELPVMRAITGLVGEQRERGPSWTHAAREWSYLLDKELHHELRSDFDTIVEAVRNEYDAVLGPTVELLGPRDVDLGRGTVVAFDFDDFDDAESGLRLPDGFEWTQSAFAKAALLYKRECGWDFAPGEAGVWLAYFIFTESMGSESAFFYHGNLVGFAILQDRDEDGRYESIAHVWTAKAARRKGVARELVAQARRDFPVRTVEAPFTKPGGALIGAAWPEKADGEAPSG